MRFLRTTMILLFFISMPACKIPEPTTEYAKIRLNVNAFVKLGCRELAEGKLDCSNTTIPKKYHCNEILELVPNQQSLTPSTPIALCKHDYNYEDEEQVKGMQCFAHFGLANCTNAIIIVDEEIVLLDSPEEYLEQFSPIDSEEEALVTSILLTCKRSSKSVET